MASLKAQVQDFEKIVILRHLIGCGTLREAATKLGISRKCLWQKMKRYQIPTEFLRPE